MNFKKPQADYQKTLQREVAFYVRPVVHISGKFGARIEDDVVIVSGIELNLARLARIDSSLG